MTAERTRNERIWLYLRLTLGSSLVGIAYGYYLQVMGDLQMTAGLALYMAVRGVIVGALFWWFEIFVSQGPIGGRFRELAYGPRLAVRVIGYLIAVEGGLWIGRAILGDVQAAVQSAAGGGA